VAGRPNRSGRHPKLDPAVQRVIVESVAAGVPRKYAAQRAGIDESTLRLWCSKGRKGGKGQAIYVALLAALKKAEADAVARNVAIVQKAANTTWQAAAWWLERRYHAEFGRKGMMTNATKEKSAPGADPGLAFLGQIAALLAARDPQPPGGGGAGGAGAGGPPVGAPPGPPGEGLPERG
jgi:transposase